MKKIHLFILAGLLTGGLGCTKEWTKELFVKEVTFVKSGVVNVFAQYKNQGGNVALKVPVAVSGSTSNSSDIDVTIELDKDTVTNLNFDRFRLRQDLYFLELPEQHYKFRSMTTKIPAGSEQGYFDLDLNLQGLDMSNKYMLPVKIVRSSSNNVTKRRWFSKSLMWINLFNDFSGRFSNAGLIWNRDVPQNNQTALSTPYRNAWVVDERSVFFFAGNIDEESFDRRKYKIIATFNPDSTVSLSAPDPAINFAQQKGNYTIRKRKHEVYPYLELTYITMTLEYWYSDITNPAFPINYRFTGPLTLERVRNTQIPEEDQQVRIE